MNERTKQMWMRRLRNTFLISFLYSLLVHGILLGMWMLGILNLPDALVQLLFRRKPETAQVSKPQPTNSIPVPKEIPLTFIEVEPETSSQEPKDPKFYSTANTQAANPDPPREALMPKSDGRQDRIAKLRDIPRASLPPPPGAPPTPPPPTPPKRDDLALRPSPLRPGELPMPAPLQPQPKIPDLPKPAEPSKDAQPSQAQQPKPPSPEPSPDTTPSPRTRPRTLAQAREQAGLAGEKMKQEGGARRAGKLAVDARSTPFGVYDAAMIRAVQDRWYYLLDNTSVTPRSGRVILDFTLKYDGSIIEMRVRETEVGEVLALLCQRAVTDPAPYQKWPADMHRMVGAPVRPVTITFLYY